MKSNTHGLQHRVMGNAAFGCQDQIGRFKVHIVDEIQRVKQCRAVQFSSVVKQVVVGQVIPFSARVSKVACGPIFEALQPMVHQNLSVGGVLS